MNHFLSTLRELRVGPACSCSSGGLLVNYLFNFFTLQTNTSTRNLVIQQLFSLIIKNLSHYEFDSNSSQITTYIVIPPASTTVSGGAANV